MVQLKRAYEPPSRTDGYRVLVDRLWPRGVKKDELRLDLWAKELGYRPEPYCIADAFMFSDDKNIVQITDMTVRLTGLNRSDVESL